MDFKLSDEIIEGLKYLNTIIDPDITKKLISNAIKCVIDTPSAEIYKPESNYKYICHSEYSVLTLFVLANKYNLTSEKLKSYLESYEINNLAILQLINFYDLFTNDFSSSGINKTNLTIPKVTEVDWKLSCDVKTSSFEIPSGELNYKINFGNFNDENGAKEKLVEFTCNTEELQSLINKLKDIERHCEKLNTII